MDKKPVIEISDKGIRNSQIPQHSVVSAYEQSGRKVRSNTKNIDSHNANLFNFFQHFNYEQKLFVKIF